MAKTTYLIAGLFIGAIVSFFLTKSLYHTNFPTSAQSPRQAETGTLHTASKWNWPDSLDAIKVASGSHKIVYEDSTVRILQVVLEPNNTEPVHTHQWKSIMWFTQATPMVYYKYGLVNNKLIVQDSIPIPQMPAEVLNHGEVVEAEEPHAIKNKSSQPGIAYRLEFKKEFKP